MKKHLLRPDERVVSILRMRLAQEREDNEKLLARLFEEREISDHYLQMLTDARLKIAKLQRATITSVP